MRVYVAGCGGMLGDSMFKVFSEFGDEILCTDIDVNATWLRFCDFREFDSYYSSVLEFTPEILVHLGAHTDLEYCERNPDDAYLTNTLSVENAATIATKLRIPVVYISTAGIFDGKKQLYDDWDIPNPLGVYARSKFLGEIIVQQRVSRHFIFRAGWMMGGGQAKDKKFIAKIMRQIISGKKKLQIVNDKLGTPTYTVDFARNVREMLKTEYYGLYNMVCGGETGRLEVAQELIKILNCSDEITIEPVNSDYFSEEFFAPRPPSERLVNYKLNLRNLNLMRDWRVALAEYVSREYADWIRK